MEQTNSQKQISEGLGKDVRMWLIAERNSGRHWHEIQADLQCFTETVPHRATLQLWMNEAKSYL